MPSIKAIAGQTWIDLVLQITGDEHRLFELCDLHNAGITDDVATGAEIETLTPTTRETQNIADKLSIFKPSSMFYKTGDPAPEGIEYWAIETDFIVS